MSSISTEGPRAAAHSAYNHGYADDDEIDLRALAALLWGHKFLIGFLAGLFFLIAVLYLHFAEPVYRATLQVTAPQGQQSSSPGGGLGALAELAGAGGLLGGADATSFELYLAGLTSLEAANRLTANEPLMRRIFASEWSEQTQSWVEPNSAVRDIIRTIKPWLGVKNLPWSPPGGQRLQEYLEKNSAIGRDKKSPIVTITFEDPDPELARMVLTMLHREMDILLRARNIRRSTDHIEYLTGKLATVTVLDYRQALIQALAKQEQNLMASSSDQPFAAEPFGDVFVSRRPVKPQNALVLALGMISGLFAGMFFVFARAAIRGELTYPPADAEYHATTPAAQTAATTETMQPQSRQNPGSIDNDAAD